MKSSRGLVLILSLWGSIAVAAAPDKDLIQLSLKLGSQESDNALRSHDNPLSERQDILGADLNAHLKSDWANLVSRYDLVHWNYSENSQPDYNQIEGRTSLILGKADLPLGASLEHSRHATLISPDAVDISSNRDERTIISAQPWLNWRLDGTDNLRLAGIYSEVDYQKNEEKNLTEKGAVLSWNHKLSKTDQLGLSVQSTRNNYLLSSDFDYNYKAVLVNYSAHLSHLSYSISAGENQAEQINKNLEIKSPLYKFELTYRSAANEVGVYFGQSVTNTSNGDGNREGLGVHNSEGAESAKDLIRLREDEVYWTTRSLCALCSLRLGVSMINNDYENLPDDETQRLISARFSYQMSRAATVSLGVSRDKHSYADTSLLTEYTEQITDLSLDYKLAKSTMIKFYLRNEKRDTDVVLQTYAERILGLSLLVEF